MEYATILIEKFINYLPNIAGALVTLVIGFWLVGWVTKLVRHAMMRRKIDETVQPFLASLVDVGLKVLLLLSVAGMFGIETTSFIAIFSALALSIGLALQGNLGHFASGVLLLIFRPFKVGDWVKIGDFEGHITEIQVFNTVLVTNENKKVFIPNGVITSGAIVNLSGMGDLKVFMRFGVSYDDPIDEVRKVILEVAQSCPQILQDKPIEIFVEALGTDAIEYAVRPWCHADDYWDVYFYMHEHVMKALDKHGMNVPFPQMDVRLHKDGWDFTQAKAGTKN
ncbi:MAG: mechanosensitive ion channel [Saprospiraceae bacterium]|nr:mechanosensitive ion channel [Saprospiraceae bacterium]